MTVFLCENGFDGILSGVYEVYASHLPLEECRLEMKEEYEPMLFAEYREIPVNAVYAEKVVKKIQTHMSQEAYLRLYRTALHKRSDRADWILRFIALGLKYGKQVVRMLQNPVVSEIFRMDGNVAREAHAFVEFARFEQLATGIYYGRIGPEHQVLELVARHFADRFPDMNWVLHDELHRSVAVHSERGEWVVKERVTDEEMERLLAQRITDVYIDLWKVFFETIAIEERKNEKCQKNMLPLRYRKYMAEFQ